MCCYETIDYNINIKNINNSKSITPSSGKLNETNIRLSINVQEVEAIPGDVLQVTLFLFNIDSQDFQIYAFDYLGE